MASRRYPVGYATPYQTDGRKVVKAGMRFSTETLAIEDWVIEI